MCGIVGIFNIQEQTPELRQKALRMSQKIRHRGPDWSGIYTGPTAILCHERLSIVDPESGRQPLFSPDKSRSWLSTVRYITIRTSVPQQRTISIRLDPTVRSSSPSIGSGKLIPSTHHWFLYSSVSPAFSPSPSTMSKTGRSSSPVTPSASYLFI